MKILQIIPSFEVAGAEIMCENLIYALKKLGHDVVAVSFYNYKSAITERLNKNDIKVYFLDKKKGFDITIYKKLKNILNKESPNAIHTHLYVTKYVFPIARRFKIKVIHTIHSIATKECTKISRLFNKFYYIHKDAIPVALSKNIQETIYNLYKIDKKFIPVIFNGIDLKKCNVKESYHIDEIYKILHIGRFMDEKNHYDLIDAFFIFHNKYPKSKLFLIGDGILRSHIEKYVDEKNLNNAVSFLGIQSDVYIFLTKMDVFVLSSKYEGMPMTLIEAMGTGMPIVSTNVGGISDMLDSKSAILVPVNVFKINEALEKFYLNEDLRKNKGLEALKYSQKFSAENMALKYLELYNEGGK